MIRRLILAFALMAGVTPAIAQAPSPVPALPDSERRTSYSISGTDCSCSVGFMLLGDASDYWNWVEVWINGVRYDYNDASHGWTITSPSGPLSNLARPITNAILTFNQVQTGTVQIVGARRPRRASQFTENAGVSARNLNQVLTDIISQNREIWDKTNDMTGRAVLALPGETLSTLPPAATRAGQLLGFDGSGNTALYVPQLPASNQSANTLYAGPTSGPAATPAFRALVGADLPTPGASSLGGVESKTCSSSNWFNTLSTGGAFGCSQPAFSDLTGSIACSQMPAHTGDVTSSAGSCALTIANSAVTYAKVQNVAASRLLGNPIGSPAAPSEISLGSTLTFSGAALQTGALTGDVTASANSFATSIAANAVTNAKMATMAAFTFKANVTGSGTTPTDVEISTLTTKASPAAGDFIILSDQAAAGAVKKATVSSLASAGSVASFNGQTGAITFLTSPQGRLTLQANTPVMVTSQTAQSTLRYDCSVGNQVPYYTGSADAWDTISSCEVTDAMVSAASAGQVVSGQVYDAWWVHSGANRICLAMSSASGGGGGWASDTSGSSTARGTGYSQLDFTTRPYITNKNSISNCFNGSTNYGAVSANQATYLGTVLASANGQISYTFGSAAAGGGAATFGVWNYYNRVSVDTVVEDSTAAYGYNTASWRSADNSTSNRVTYVYGVSEDGVEGTYGGNYSGGNLGGSSLGLGIGVDSISSPSGNTFAVSYGSGIAGNLFSGVAAYGGQPGLGLHFLQALEYGNATGPPTFNNRTAPQTTGFRVRLRM